MQRLSIKEAQKWLEEHNHKLSDKTIRKYIKNGILQAIMDVGAKHGDRYLITLESLETLINPGNLHGSTVEETIEAPSSNVSTALVPMLDVYSVQVMVGTMEKRLEARLEQRLEARLEERDQRLVEVMRRLMEEKHEEAQKKKPGLVARVVKRLFG